jgi:hypothetical protein
MAERINAINHGKCNNCKFYSNCFTIEKTCSLVRVWEELGEMIFFPVCIHDRRDTVKQKDYFQQKENDCHDKEIKPCVIK